MSSGSTKSILVIKKIIGTFFLLAILKKNLQIFKKYSSFLVRPLFAEITMNI
jgi:hypothetical protein